MTKQILAFLFCFTRELNLYTPLTYSLISARELKPYTPPLPSPSTHLSALKPKAEGFIELRSRLYKTFGFNLTHHPSTHPPAKTI